MKRAFPLVVIPLIALVSSSPFSRAGESWANTDGKAASSVLGQADFFSDEANRNGPPGAGTLSNPSAIAVDPTTGKVFVSDLSNNRVLRFSGIAALQNGATAEAVLGQANFTSVVGAAAVSRMWGPRGLKVDSGGRLWVADSGNNRVLRFDNASAKDSGANADGVLGQPDFDTRTADTSRSKMSHPIGIDVDNTGRLWVADSDNNRVLRFDNAAGRLNGADPDRVLGQGSYNTNDSATARDGMYYPTHVAADNAGRLWVSDGSNHRVLRFDNVLAKGNGADADGVLGQAEFTTDTIGLSANQFQEPWGIDMDAQGRLWVVDRINYRVLRFDNAAAKGDGANADGVLGADDFTTRELSPPTEKNLTFPEGILAGNQGRLWVADSLNHRVLRFQAIPCPPAGPDLVARAAVRKKMSKIKRQLKSAKRKKKTAQIKRLKRKLKKLKAKLRSL